MISFERWQDGFLLTVEGMRVLRHSSRYPAIFAGSPRKTLIPVRGMSGDEEMPFVWKGIGPATIMALHQDRISLRFEQSFLMEITYADRVLRIRLSGGTEAGRRLKFKFGANPRDRVYGAGPTADFNLKPGIAELEWNTGEGARSRIPSVFTSSGGWLFIDASGRKSLRFSATATVLESHGILGEIAMGFGLSMRDGMMRMTGYAGGGRRAGIPQEYLKGLVAPPRAPAPRESADVPSDAPAVTPVPEGDWEDMHSGGSIHPLDRGLSVSDDLTRVILSLSFSGKGLAYLPAGDSKSLSRTLDTAMFSPLFVLSSLPPPVTQEERQHLLRAAAVFEALAPYRSFCVGEWVTLGIPFWTHPALHHPDDGRLLMHSDMLAVGEDLVVALPRADLSRRRKLYLPAGEWVHLWTSRVFGGGSVTIDAPPGLPAAFYRRNCRQAPLFDHVRRIATRL